MSKRALVLTPLSVALGFSLTVAGPAAADSTDSSGQGAEATFFSAELNGANEVQPADPDGTGKAFVRVEGDEVCFAISWENLPALGAAHIHSAPAGVNGPVLVGFFTTALPDNLTAVTGCATSNAETVDAIKADPASFYINMHTAEFPAGAVRGQLKKMKRPVDLHKEFRRGSLVAVGDGAQEVPGPGDADGRSIALFRLGDEGVRFSASWQDIEPPTAAHIHPGAAGVANPPIVPMFSSPGLPPTINGVAGIAPAEAEVMREIRRDPAAFYYNIHNPEFPPGAARGQLIRIRWQPW